MWPAFFPGVTMPTFHRPLLAACLLALSAPSFAVSLVADGQWNTFDVDELSAASTGLEWIDLFNGGTALSFDFDIAAGYQGTLTVVDGGFAGDRFEVRNGGLLLGVTSAAVSQIDVNVGLDFDAALADSAYSRASYTLAAGSHSVSGWLSQSALFEGLPLNATVGALRLEVSAVPEPSALAMLLAGVGVLGFVARRRAI
jgi:PEP-CTERM motif